MTNLHSIVLVVATVVAARGALAQAPKQLKPAAQAHLDAGLKAYENKQYDVAGREFELAYQIDPDPPLLYASAQALRLGGDCAHALELYRQFLDAKPTDAQITAANTGIELCASRKPPPKPAPVIVVEPPRHERSRQDTPRWYQDKLGDALVASGAVGLGIGIGYLVAGSASQHHADTAEFHDDFVRYLDEATTRRRIGAIAIGGGSALVIGGVLSYLFRDRGDHTLVGGIDGHTLYVAGVF